MKKSEVLKIIDEVMNNREIDSIRNAILAIRDKVLEHTDDCDTDDYDIDFKPVTLALRGNNPLCETSPWFEGANYVVIDPLDKIDSGIYGSIRYTEDKPE